MQTTRRILAIAVLLGASGAAVMESARGADTKDAGQHLSGLPTRITFRDGSVRTASLQGLGCTASICSRVAMKGKAKDDSWLRFWLDGISSIRAISPSDAVLVMKNGAEQRIALVPDFRVLYLGERYGKPEKLDLTAVEAIEFVAAHK